MCMFRFIKDVVTDMRSRKGSNMKFSLWVKNTFDRCFSILLFVLLIPLFLVIGIAIRINSKGPVIFKQKRLGQNGRLFVMYKFRTMVQDAKPIFDGEGSTIVIQNDRRVTHIGRFLREYGLDELPQLLNIIKGEMSFIGPRPDLPDTNSEIQKTLLYKVKLSMKPGITGLAQVNGRNTLSWEEKLKYDYFYVRHFSLGLDLRIILKTIVVLIARQGAFYNRNRQSKYNKIGKPK